MPTSRSTRTASSTPTTRARSDTSSSQATAPRSSITRVRQQRTRHRPLAGAHRPPKWRRQHPPCARTNRGTRRCYNTRAKPNAGLDTPNRKRPPPRHKRGSRDGAPQGCSSHRCIGSFTPLLAPPERRSGSALVRSVWRPGGSLLVPRTSISVCGCRTRQRECCSRSGTHPEQQSAADRPIAAQGRSYVKRLPLVAGNRRLAGARCGRPFGVVSVARDVARTADGFRSRRLSRFRRQRLLNVTEVRQATSTMVVRAGAARRRTALVD